MTTDPTITIAGLRAKVSALIDHLETANQSRVNFSCGLSKMEAHAAEVEAERDALAAQLAEVRAKLDAAPKVCAIHSYEHGPGPCMTCGAWPPGTRELIAACRTRIAGLEQAADERSKEVARLTARVAELEARPVLTVERLTSAVYLSRGIPMDIATEAAKAIIASLGPVTLPAQDRAEELVYAWRGICTDTATCDLDPAERMRRALASLGAPPTSPPAARPVFAGVSVGELEGVFVAAERACKADTAAIHLGCCRLAGLRAVLARLEASLVAPVDPEAFARDFQTDLHQQDPDGWTPFDSVERGGQDEMVAAMRATLTAAGIPVTPEVGK